MHTEHRPKFCDPVIRKVGRLCKTNAFTKLRAVCSDYGLTLERGPKGYYLSGGDLPMSGEHYRTLDDVKEELINYGWEE